MRCEEEHDRLLDQRARQEMKMVDDWENRRSGP